MSINKRKRESCLPVVSSIANPNGNCPTIFSDSLEKLKRNTSSVSKPTRCQKTDSFFKQNQKLSSSSIKSLSSIDFATVTSRKNNSTNMVTQSDRESSQDLIPPQSFMEQSSNKLRVNNISNPSSISCADSSDSFIPVTESSAKIFRQLSNSSLPSDLNDSETTLSFTDLSSAQISNSSSISISSILNSSALYKSVKPLQSAFSSSGLLSKHHHQDTSLTNSPIPLANSSSIFVDQNDDENNIFSSYSSHNNSKLLKKIAPDTPCKRTAVSLLNTKNFNNNNNNNNNNNSDIDDEVSFKKVLKRSSMNYCNNFYAQNTQTDSCLSPIKFDNDDDFSKDKENHCMISFKPKDFSKNSKGIPALSCQLSSANSQSNSIPCSTFSRDSASFNSNNASNGLLFPSNSKNRPEGLSKTTTFKKRVPFSLKLDPSFNMSLNSNDGYGLASPNLDSLCSPLSPTNNMVSFGFTEHSSQNPEKIYEEDIFSPVTSKFILQNHKNVASVATNKKSNGARLSSDNATKSKKYIPKIEYSGNKSKLKTTNLNSNRYSLMRSCSVENYFNQNPSITSQPPLKTPKTPMFCLDSSFDEDAVFLCNKFGHENVEIIGKGEFSKVYRVSFKFKTYAIKQLINGKKSGQLFKSKTKVKLATNLNNDSISKFLCMDQDYKFTRLEEIQLLNYIKQRQHSRGSNDYFYKELIVHYVDFFNHENSDYIIMNHYVNGSLGEFLLNQKDSMIPEFTTWKILLNLLEAVSFLHSEGIIHLDLKPDNIFINSSNSLTIADFGMSVINYDSNSSTKIDREGDRIYIAPEILSSSVYTTAADIFALGLIILETSANIYLPNNGESWQKLRNEDLSDASPISKKRISKTVDRNLENLNFVNDGHSLESTVKSMLCSDYQKRIKADALLEFPYFKFIKQYAKMGSTIIEPKYTFVN